MGVAAAVGFTTHAQVAARTGVVMLLYLDRAYDAMRRRCEAERLAMRLYDLRAAIMSGAVDRVRPKIMTVAAIISGLLPILWSNGTGSEIMSCIAVPMIGRIISSAALTLIVIPAVFLAIKAPEITYRVSK